MRQRVYIGGLENPAGRASGAAKEITMVENSAQLPPSVAGWVQNPQQQYEGSNAVWTFRLLRYDQDRNALPPVPVEAHADSFQGAVNLNHGDHVTVEGTWREGTLLATKVENATTHSVTEPKLPPKPIPVSVKIFLMGSVMLLIIVCCASVALFALFGRSVVGTTYECQVLSNQIAGDQQFLQNLKSSRTNPALADSQKQSLDTEIHAQETKVADEQKKVAACR